MFKRMRKPKVICTFATFENISGQMVVNKELGRGRGLEKKVMTSKI